VFCNRKLEVDVVAKSLKAHGFDAAPIHGDLDQQTRMRTLEAFRKGELRLLVASDVAARGLDVPDVSHVFNYDVPHHADDYVHRIGRTGRAGRTGQTFMIVTPADSRNLDKVIKLIGSAPEEVVLDIDWSQVKDEGPRRGGPERGRGRSGPRERSGERSGERSRRPSREPARAEAAPAEVAEAAPAPPPPERVPEPAPEARRPPRHERHERPERHERRPAAAPESPPPAARARGRDDDDRSQVKGFGSEIPAFLSRPSTPTPRKD